MSKILLIQPRDKADNYFPERPTMGLGYLAGALIEKGNEVKIVDMRFQKYGNRYLIETIKKFCPEFIGFTLTSLTMKNSFKIIKILKKHSNAKIICGGPEVSLLPNKVMKNKNVDFCITHEGDISFPRFVKEYPKDKSWMKIPGLAYRKKDKIIINSPRFIDDLDSIPFPAWELFPLKDYNLNVESIQFPVLSSRGCPYNCMYCDSTLINGKYRIRSPKNVVDEIESDINKFGARNFQFIDDNFALIQDRVYSICNEIIDRGLNISWIVGQGFTANRSNYQMFKLMKKAGCKAIYFGVESADDEVLKFIRKPANLNQIKDSINAAHKAGLKVKAPFISGLPKSSFKKELKYIDFFKEMDIDMPRMSTIIPFPNTDLYKWVEKNAIPLGSLETAHERLSQTRGALDTKMFFPAYETQDFSKEERIKILRIFQRESEKWILEKRFGKIFGYFVFLLTRNNKIRRLGFKVFRRIGKNYI